jgi:uncharacterized protein (UPF0332 family)
MPCPFRPQPTGSGLLLCTKSAAKASIYDEAGIPRLSQQARRILQQVHALAGIELPAVAGRTAYLAAYHAAQAFIFDRTVVKFSGID